MNRCFTGPRFIQGLSLLVVLAATPAAAVDGVIEISQAKAEASGGFPVTIDQPGSYRLTGDLVLPALGSKAILVTASNVHIDLNGFSILGMRQDPADPNAPFGVGVDGPTANDVTVVNGRIVGTGGTGVNLGERARVENVTVSLAGLEGIQIGSSSVVRHCHVNRTRFAGIVMFSSTGGIIEGNRVTGNGAGGIQGGNGSRISGNVATDNESHGILCLANCIMTGNVAETTIAEGANDGRGILAGSGSLVQGNRASGNDSHGIRISGVGVTVIDNNAFENLGDGIHFSSNMSQLNGIGGNVAVNNTGTAISSCCGNSPVVLAPNVAAP